MMMRIAGAPITWGVCEVPGWGVQLDRDAVLSEIAAAGFQATELGPPGFLPEDPSELSALLKQHRLSLVAGFVPVVLHRPAVLDQALAQVRESAETLAGAGGQVLVLAAQAGNTSYETSLELSDDDWQEMRRGLTAVEQISEECGLTLVLHPHYGTLIERECDVRRLLETTTVKLCLDTGHLILGGSDPLAISNLAAGRIAHVHLKDVNLELAQRVRSGEIGYRDAVSRGLYRPLGAGGAKIEETVRSLRRSGYEGWYVIEQDIVIQESSSGDEPLRNARQSLVFLQQVMA